MSLGTEKVVNYFEVRKKGNEGWFDERSRVRQSHPGVSSTANFKALP